jgi:electron transport complex protein RnfG
MITSVGYGGEVKLVSGIDSNGKIIKTMILSHTETKGFGDRAFEENVPKYEQMGKSNIGEIDAVTGATISSNALKDGIMDAFDAYEIIEEVLEGE